MEQARIVIIGAGPAGLVLALSLAQHNVSSIILERETDVNRDPRGVYLATDANRILWSLGLGAKMPGIGNTADSVKFHTSSFVNEPFYTLDTSRDELLQTVPTGIFMIQPELEKALREKVNASKVCDLRAGCDVQRIREREAGAEVEYVAPDKSTKCLQTTWLIGADGKRGVVRKTFLEPLAGIRQVESDYRYEGTWIAANLKISLPTPETHPDLPAWKLGMTPQEMYDLFWPEGWHFCSPPGKPTATGRFGPVESRLWRHEFRQEDYNDNTMDAEELLWEHLKPMITRNQDDKGRRFNKAVTYPRDCIEILRCRPFAFAHKVVNKWYHKKTILIGDAAHVFPPFGGQGIASGLRDAHQLAWRIAALEKQPNNTRDLSEAMLDEWARERARSVKDAANFTKMNGMLCNNRKHFMFPLFQAMEWFTHNFLGSNSSSDAVAAAEKKGFHGRAKGFFLDEHGGGRRLPQIYVDTLFERRLLSDGMFGPQDSPLRLLVLHRGSEVSDTGIDKIQKMLSDTRVPKDILSPDSIMAMSTIPCQPESIGSFASPGLRKVSPTPVTELSLRQARAGYDVTAFETRLGKDTKYVIARPDFYVFAAAKDLDELRACFEGLKGMLK